ncbi:efflux transporter outer membrane subunit [Desulfatiferula olefinivorans]
MTLCRRIAALTAVVLLSGCGAMFTPKARPPVADTLPGAYSLYTDGDPGPGPFWTAFGSEELNRLIDEALSSSFDIRTARTRLNQADAALRKVGADLIPSVMAEAGAARRRTRTETDGTPARTVDSRSFSAGLTAAYELDVWGRLSALRKAEFANYEAAREDLDTAALTVASAVVTTWIDILSARRQIALLAEQITINRQLTDLQVFRFSQGKASALEVAQQRQVLAAAKARMPRLQLVETQSLQALAFLLGRSDPRSLSLSPGDLPALIPLPPTGLPADLLSTRPDVRAAGLKLQGADFRIAAARANRLPSLTLSAGITFAADSTDLVFQNWIAGLAAGLTGPLFDGGARKAEVDRQRALADETLTAYAKTVARAIREVEAGLSAEQRQKEYLTLLAAQLDAARLTMAGARSRYLNGQNTYPDYLTAWSGVQDLEMRLIDENASLIRNRVALYKALGGDWARTLVRHPDKNPADTGGDSHPETASAPDAD